MTVPVNRAMLASQTAKSNRTKIDQFPLNIGPHGMMMVFRDYKFQSSTTRELLNLPTGGTNVVTDSNGAVLLPIPNTLNDATNLNVSTYNMADVLGYETAAASSAWAMGTLGDYTPQKTNSFSSLDALTLAKKIFGDNFYLGAAGQGVGATINPKASLLFRGIELKDYAFEWTLAPSEAAESEALRKIVRKIKANALPSYRTESVFTAAMLNYPSTVDIYLLGVDPNHYLKFKTAMVTDVTVNYAPQQLSILKGGRPASVNLTIRLKEMDIHTAADYGGGGIPASQDGGPMAEVDTLGNVTGLISDALGNLVGN